MTEKKLIQTPIKNIKFATGECICPSLGQLLTNYAVNDLNEPAVLLVEEHLLACRACRERFVKMSKIFGKKEEADHPKSDEEENAKRFKIVGKQY